MVKIGARSFGAESTPRNLRFLGGPAFQKRNTKKDTITRVLFLPLGVKLFYCIIHAECLTQLFKGVVTFGISSVIADA